MANLIEAQMARQLVSDNWFRKDGVAAVGVGPFDNLDPTKGSAVVIFAEEGRGAELTAQLPRRIDVQALGRHVQVPVRVIESGEFIANGVWELRDRFDPEYARTIRPAKTGYSVGIQGGAPGTISMCLYLDGAAAQKKYLLSNAHAISANQNGQNLPIVQAATGDDLSSAVLANFDSVRPLVPPPAINRMDAAIAVPTIPDDFVDLWDNRPVELAPPPGVGLLPVSNLEKCGRTTGRVAGIAVFAADIHINYRGWAGLNLIDFQDMRIIAGPRPVSLPGDSGSLWVLNSESVRAYAINFAGPRDGMHSVAFPWCRVYEHWPRWPSPAAHCQPA